MVHVITILDHHQFHITELNIIFICLQVKVLKLATAATIFGLNRIPWSLNKMWIS